MHLQRKKVCVCARECEVRYSCRLHRTVAQRNVFACWKLLEMGTTRMAGCEPRLLGANRPGTRLHRSAAVALQAGWASSALSTPNSARVGRLSQHHAGKGAKINVSIRVSCFHHRRSELEPINTRVCCREALAFQKTFQKVLSPAKQTIFLPLHALIEMLFVWKLMASYLSYRLKTTTKFPAGGKQLRVLQ